MGGTDHRADSQTDPRGLRIGKYELLRRLAVGGMAELFLARTTGLQGFEKIVVLKRILPQLAGNAEFVEMFLHEARLAATLEHPNVVHVSDFGQAGRDYFFVMAYVHGKDLLAILRATYAAGQRLPLAHAVTIAIGISAGLHYAHEHVGFDGRPLGIVHRDISPANVLVTYDGHVKVVDFGIAKAAAQTAVTRVGVRKGKAAYMAPEQCRGREVDRRCDIFAVGVVLWEMTTMSRLYEGAGDMALMNQIVHEDARRPSMVVPGYPPALEAIVMRCLARDPDRRFQTVQELQLALEHFALEHRLGSSTGALAQYLQALFPADVRALPWATEESAMGPPLSSASAPTRAEPLGTDIPTRAEPTDPSRGPTTNSGTGPTTNSGTGPTTSPSHAAPSTMPGAAAASRGGGTARYAVVPAHVAAAPVFPPSLPTPGTSLPSGGFSGPGSHTELHRRRRSVTPWVLSGVVVGAILGVAGWRVGLAVSAANTTANTTAPIEDPPPPAPVELTGDEVDAMLVLVNQPNPSLALDYPRRHALLARLRSQPSAVARVDEPLAMALDLLQALQAPEPCTVFEAALVGLEATPAPALASMIEEARAPDQGCNALEDRREALVRSLRPAGPAPGP